MSKIVRYEIDLNNPPPLTQKQQAELKALEAMPDESIDFSDIAPLDDAFWKNAVRNPFYKPVKTSTTCLLYTSPSPRDRTRSRMPSSA